MTICQLNTKKEFVAAKLKIQNTSFFAVRKNMNTYFHKLHFESWLSVYNADGPENAYDTFINTIMGLYDKAFLLQE